MTALDTKALLEGVTDPGGWQIKSDYGEGSYTVITNADGEYVDGAHHYTYDFVAICEDEYGEVSPDAHRNARLIASAPRLARRVIELEEALETVPRVVLEQRCERGTPWDLACVSIAEKVREHVAAALKGEGDA